MAGSDEQNEADCLKWMRQMWDPIEQYWSPKLTEEQVDWIDNLYGRITSSPVGEANLLLEEYTKVAQLYRQVIKEN